MFRTEVCFGIKRGNVFPVVRRQTLMPLFIVR
jgi:hypothetical protein